MDNDDNNGEIDEGPITKLEVKNAIQEIKNSKAAGIEIRRSRFRWWSYIIIKYKNAAPFQDWSLI